MTTQTRTSMRCPRCNGTMAPDRVEGDTFCINCGARAYHTKPLPYVSMNHGKTTRKARPGAGRPKKQPLRQEIEAARAQVLVFLRKHPGATTTAIADGLGIHRKAAESRLDSMLTAHLVAKEWKAERALPNRWFIAEGEGA